MNTFLDLVDSTDCVSMNLSYFSITYAHFSFEKLIARDSLGEGTNFGKEF